VFKIDTIHYSHGAEIHGNGYNYNASRQTYRVQMYKDGITDQGSLRDLAGLYPVIVGLHIKNT
jgi:hypothetical protein